MNKISITTTIMNGQYSSISNTKLSLCMALKTNEYNLTHNH